MVAPSVASTVDATVLLLAETKEFLVALMAGQLAIKKKE
jgi:hypothetical protein